MLLSSIVLGLSLHAAPPPQSYVVVSRRSGVLRGQAFDLAVAARKALLANGLPAAALAEDATDCAARRPCLLERARKKKASVLVTVDVGAVLEDVLVHAEALSVEEDGLKVASVDVEGRMETVGASLEKQVTATLVPAVRAHFKLAEPAPEVTPPPAPVAEVLPPPPPAPSPAVTEPPVVEVPSVEKPAPESSGFWTVRRIAGAAVGGAGVVAAGTGLVMLGLASGSDASVRQLCPANQQCSDPAAYDAYARAASQQNTGVVLLGAGAAVAVAGAVLLLLPGGEDAPAQAALVPLPGGAAVSVSGHF